VVLSSSAVKVFAPTTSPSQRQTQWHGFVLPTVSQLPARPGAPAANASALEADGAVTSGKSPMLVHVMATGLSW
jgi:hypothetical protein